MRRNFNRDEVSTIYQGYYLKRYDTNISVTDINPYDVTKIGVTYRLYETMDDVLQADIVTKFYMIDFRNTYKLDCEKIVSPKDAPLEAKVLELSIEARADLRNKIAFYYGRTPQEDIK